MSVPISNVPRRVVLVASGTGPYSFNFEILAPGDISVYRDDDLLTLTTDYTVTINTNGTGYVTLTATPTGATQIAIVGDRAIQRTSDFTTGGDLFAVTLNEELDSLTIFAQQNAEATQRALIAPQTDPTTIDMTLPRAADRANKYLVFDADGNPESGDTSVDIALVAANIDNINIVKGEITPTNNIETVAGANANITTVAGNITNVNAVGAISSNVTTVAGIAANVTTVAGISTDVTTVALNVADITNFADVYLGPKTSDPSTRNDSSALQAGDLYFNTADNVVKVYTGTIWAAAYVPSDGFLVAANNLSDLTNASTARENLGVEIGVDVQAYDANTAKLDVAQTFTAVQIFSSPIVVPEIIYPSASFSWNSATSSPAKSYFDEPVKLIAAHRNMRRCLLLDNGTVNYYLDENDSTKKADGTSATLTGADGMVMVEIPKFYTKCAVSGTVTTWFVSDYPLTGYTVHPAFVKDGVEVDKRYYSAYDACAFDVSGSAYISGLNRDNAVSNTPNVDVTESTGDKLASVSGIYPMVGLTRAQFRTIAANRGTGWRQLDFALWSAVQLLYLTEHQSFFSQSILGDGNTSGSYLTQSGTQSDSPHTIAGVSNGWGNFSTNGSQPSAGAKPGTAFMVYRGIENLYGNCWNWADGINVNVTSNGNVHVTNNRADFADDTSTNMTLISTTAPTTSGFVSAIAAIDNYFIASSVSGGSATTFLTDQWFGSTSSNRVVRVGGGAATGANAGAFAVDAPSDSSSALRNIGARLAF